MNPSKKPRVALVHHWLVARRGGERLFEAIAQQFPEADIFTLVHGDMNIFSGLKDHRIVPSFLQRLPRPSCWYPYYLPFFPAAVARLDLTGYDLIISSDAAAMKGVRVDPGAIHLCYCHAPMRYVWTGYETYYRAAGPAARLVLWALRDWLRRWDYDAAQRVTLFIANSRNVQKRIKDCYERESVVIYPPVEVDRFVLPGWNDSSRGYFLLVSQLVPYKRIDIVVEAFNRCGRNLFIIGDGPERRLLEQKAKSNVQFLGPQTHETVVNAMQQCEAFIFAGEEDFGIVMAEVQACGKPVIAYAKGGASEIVQSGTTGILFEEQSVDSLLEALEAFNPRLFDAFTIRSTAMRFGRERFHREFSSLCQVMLDVPAPRECCEKTLQPSDFCTDIVLR